MYSMYTLWNIDLNTSKSYAAIRKLVEYPIIHTQLQLKYNNYSQVKNNSATW